MLILSSALIFLTIIPFHYAVWLPKDPLNLGVYLTSENATMTACHLRDTTYVSVYTDSVSRLVTHFTWTEAGQKSNLRTFELSFTMSLLCLKNGQYLIVSYGPELSYDNYTFRFFNEDGTLTKIFSYNDTIYQYITKVVEMPNGNLLMSPKTPSETDNFKAPIVILDKNGNVLKRKVFDFNIPPTANEHNSPLSYTFLRTAVNENNQIILGTYNADWEMDLTLSSTAYFPKRVYYNLSILDANLSTIQGPAKFYSSRIFNEYEIIPMGTDNFGFVSADRFNYALNLSIYNMNLQSLASDSIKISNQPTIFAKPVGTNQEGIVALGQGTKGAFWQSYNKNGTKKGDFVTLGEDFRFLNNVQLKSGDDVGILYLKSDSVFFAKGNSFANYANSAYFLKFSCFLLAVLLILF